VPVTKLVVAINSALIILFMDLGIEDLQIYDIRPQIWITTWKSKYTQMIGNHWVYR
jgi:hypothetical protein